MASSLRIAILRSDEPHHHALDASLSSRFDVVASVVEPHVAQMTRLKRKKLNRSLFWYRYHALRRKLFGLSEYRRRYFAHSRMPSDSHATRITVDDINCGEVVELLRQTAPDITVIIGTSILKLDVLRATDGPIINVHGGFLPSYRGNHCFFFALLDEAYDKIGSTIHFVDEGVDTGDIIAHAVPRRGVADTPESLYCRASALAIRRLVGLLVALERGMPLPRCEQVGAGRTYKTADRKPHHEILYWIKWAVRRLMVS